MTTQARTAVASRPGRLAVPSLIGGAVFVSLALLSLAMTDPEARFRVTGDTYPGLLTSTAEVLGYFAASLAAALCVGMLAFVVITASPEPSGRLDPAAFRVHLIIERVAIAWFALALAMIVLDAAASSGVPLGRLIRSAVIGDAIAASESARGWCAAAVFAGITALGVRFAIRWVGHVVLFGVASVGAIAVPVTGNAGQGPDHDVNTGSVMVFTVAIAILVGVKVAAVVVPPTSIDVARRVRLLVAVAGGVAVGYGAILATLLIHGNPLESGYGRLGVVAGGLLSSVWLFDLASLRRTPVASSSSASSLTAVGTATAMIAVTAALSAMAAQPAPRFLEHEFTAWDVFLGYQLPEPPGVVTLLTTWRFDPLIGTAAVVMAVLYLAGVHRLRRRGDGWPVGRTVAWMTGCVALFIVTSSSVRAYGSAMFSVHMSEHMALNMFVPVVLVLGAPVTLALRALPAAGDGRPPGPREWVLWLVHSRITGFLTHPVVAFAIFVGSLYAVYFTPLFDTFVRYHWGHELMAVHFLLTGYLFFWVIIGIDPGPRRLPFLGRLGLLFAVMPFHAFFGIATMTMTGILGGEYYRSVGLPWLTSVHDDQHLGGAIAWGSSELPVIIVVVALVAQWARQDRRAGERHDRHSDSGLDDEFDAYNAMLKELSRSRGQ